MSCPRPFQIQDSTNHFSSIPLRFYRKIFGRQYRHTVNGLYTNYKISSIHIIIIVCKSTDCMDNVIRVPSFFIFNTVLYLSICPLIVSWIYTFIRGTTYQKGCPFNLFPNSRSWPLPHNISMGTLQLFPVIPGNGLCIGHSFGKLKTGQPVIILMLRSHL